MLSLIDTRTVAHVWRYSKADFAALESLEAINSRLKDAGVLLHLSEVKGPVMDRLGQSDFPSQLTGQVFLSHYDAIMALAPELTFRPRSDK